MSSIDTSALPGPVEASGVEEGIPWAVMRHTSFGHCCGYVQLPASHPWRQDPEASRDVEVHGGITGGHPGGWIGFDTAHSCDVWPGTMFQPVDDMGIHWTVEMVAEECRQLARRAKEATS